MGTWYFGSHPFGNLPSVSSTLMNHSDNRARYETRLGRVLDHIYDHLDEPLDIGRVEMWRGSSRFGLSVAASFVWRCPNILALTPFPHPAHRTQRADLPHWALGQDITPSHTPGYAPTGAQTYETEIPVEVRGRIGPAPATSELVLVA